MAVPAVSVFYTAAEITHCSCRIPAGDGVLFFPAVVEKASVLYTPYVDKNSGQHTILSEQDIVLIRAQGEIGLQDTMVYHAMAEKAYERHGRYFSLVDADKLTGINAPARRWTAAWTRTHHVTGCAVFGGGVLQRTIITLIVRASVLIRPAPYPLGFFKTEQEARAWIARVRASSSMTKST